MERALRFTARMSVHADANGTTAWVLHLPGARLTLVLTADPYRGFSGEGGLLVRLAEPDSASWGHRLLAVLGWDPVVDPARLRAAAGLAPEEADAGLAWLAASGRLGHDLVEDRWFHRELPVDSEKVLRRHPRLRAAQALAAEGGVRRLERASWAVRGSDVEHRVRGDDPSTLTCSCPWSESHAAGRGPCKHVLAVLITET
jgi:hypothetical protein